MKADGSAAGGSTPIRNLLRHWQDGFGIRAGGSNWFRKGLEGFVGAGYDSNAVPDDRLEPVIMDVKMVTLAVGGRVDVSKHVQLGLSYPSFFGIPRDTTAESVTAKLPAPSVGPDAGGQYSQYIGVFNASVGIPFE